MKTFRLPFQKHSLREKLIEKLFDLSVKPYQWLKRKHASWGISKKNMLAMPPQSLGHDVGLFLEKNNFEVMEKCESHDVFHTLLGYETDVPNEIKMQYFLLGNGRRSWYTFVTVFLGAFILPEHLWDFSRDFFKGNKYKSIKNWYLPRMLPKNAEILRGRAHRKARRFFILKYLIIKFLRRFYQSKLYNMIYKWREKTLSNIAGRLTVFYKKFAPRNRRWQLSKSDLARFPEGTIGKDLSQFLEKNNFDILPFLETHDVYHVILGYKPTLLDEARLYFFLLGNGKRSLEVLATVWTSLWVLPDCWLDLYAHFKQGKAAPAIAHLDFKQLLHEKTQNFVFPTFSAQNTEGVDCYKITRFFLT